MVHDEVKEALRSELYKRCIDEADVTEEKIVYLLRKLGYTNFRDHAPQLWRYFTKQAPLRLTPQQEQRLFDRFIQVSDLWPQMPEELKEGRTSFPNYPFVGQVPVFSLEPRNSASWKACMSSSRASRRSAAQALSGITTGCGAGSASSSTGRFTRRHMMRDRRCFFLLVAENILSVGGCNLLEFELMGMIKNVPSRDEIGQLFVAAQRLVVGQQRKARQEHIASPCVLCYDKTAPTYVLLVHVITIVKPADTQTTRLCEALHIVELAED